MSLETSDTFTLTQRKEIHSLIDAATKAFGDAYQYVANIHLN